MKNNIIFILAAFILSLNACDTIEGNYRENATEIISTVTIFDFTGITCVNCPNAHEELKHLQETYGDNLQAIAVHGDENFAGPLMVDGKPWFLYNAIGQKLTDLTQVVGLPQGTINSLKENDYSTYSNWSTAIAAVGYKAPDVLLHVDFFINTDDTTANVVITGNFDENLSKSYGELQLGAMLLENNIVGPQYSTEGTIDPYEHNHVLRASFHDGEISDYLVYDPQPGMEIDKTYAVKLNEKWNKDNLQPVVFIYEKQNMQFLPILITYN